MLKEKILNKVLYLVASPIGNLSEISVRVKHVLSEVDLIACEDTRVTGKLLKHLEINKQLFPLHEHNENTGSEKLIELLHANTKIAYLSDAGYPCISDPGTRLVNKVIQNGIEVMVINGPSAFIPALIGSGLNTSRFYFHGFLSSKQTERLSELRKIYMKEETLIFYEAPHRLHKTVRDMYEILGDRRICIARELTKLHEEYIRTSLFSLLNIPENGYKGEMVLVVEGYNPENAKTLSDLEIFSRVLDSIKEGFSFKDAIKNVSLKHGIPKNHVYKVYLNGKENRPNS